MRTLTLLLTLPLLMSCSSEPRTGHETGNALDPDGEGDEAGGGDGGDGGAAEGEGEPGEGEGGGPDVGGEGEGEPDPGEEGEGEVSLGEGEGEGEAPDGGEGEGEEGEGEEGEGEEGEGEGEEGEGEGEPPFGECQADGGCAPYFLHCDVCDWVCVPDGVPERDCRNVCANEQDRGDPPECKCEGGACQAIRDDPPGPVQCDEGAQCEPFLDHCNCEWTCRPEGEGDDCDAECDIGVEQGPRPVCECTRQGGCEMWQPRCSSDAHCRGGDRCWLSRICGMGPDGVHCGDFQGDGQCHPPCVEGECQGDRVCTQITIWHGDAGEIASLCTPAGECGARLGGCAIGHRPGNCCDCGQPMTPAEIAEDQCVTPERDDPVPAECRRQDCDAVDCAQCFQPSRAECAGATCIAYTPVF